MARSGKNTLHMGLPPPIPTRTNPPHPASTLVKHTRVSGTKDSQSTNPNSTRPLKSPHHLHIPPSRYLKLPLNALSTRNLPRRQRRTRNRRRSLRKKEVSSSHPSRRSCSQRRSLSQSQDMNQRQNLSLKEDLRKEVRLRPRDTRMNNRRNSRRNSDDRHWRQRSRRSRRRSKEHRKCARKKFVVRTICMFTTGWMEMLISRTCDDMNTNKRGVGGDGRHRQSL